MFDVMLPPAAIAGSSNLNSRANSVALESAPSRMSSSGMRMANTTSAGRFIVMRARSAAARVCKAAS